jgi:hypothetical protein
MKIEMNDELRSIRKLDSIYKHTQLVCDPIEYVKRHKNLLYAIAEYLLLPLREAEEEVKKYEEGE